MNKIISTVVAGALILASCDNSPKFSVEGTISDAADSVLYLEQASLDGLVVLDSTKLSADGTFSFKGNAPEGCPDFYRLRIGQHIINFCIDSTETVKFTAKLPSMHYDYKVEGSEESEDIRKISVMQQNVQSRIINWEKNEDMLPGDVADSINNALAAFKGQIKQDYIYKKPWSAAAYYAVHQYMTDLGGAFLVFNSSTDRDDVKCYATVATAWDGRYPDAPRTVQLCNMASQGMNNTAAPTKRVVEIDNEKISESGNIDINLPDINSKPHSIRDLKGKVVLIDFTIYSTKESMERTRVLRSIYDKYKNQGFEIYQISLDDDVHFWKTSVEHLPWICVHETDGTTTNIYNVVNLPTFFLVNRNNEIVTRSDFMEGSLESEIQKLL